MRYHNPPCILFYLYRPFSTNISSANEYCGLCKDSVGLHCNAHVISFKTSRRLIKSVQWFLSHIFVLHLLLVCPILYFDKLEEH